MAKAQKIFTNDEVHNGDIKVVILDLEDNYYKTHFLFLSQEDVVFLTLMPPVLWINQ